MTLRYIDSFGYLPLDTTNTSATNDKLDANGYYVVYGVANTAFARVEAALGPFGDQVIRYSNGLGFTETFFDAFEVVRPFENAGSAAFYGLRIFIEDEHNLQGYRFFLGVYDAVAGERLATVTFGPFGVVKVYAGHAFDSATGLAGTLIGASKPGVWQQNEWFFAEVGCTPGVGDIQVRINTDPVAHFIMGAFSGDFTGIGWGGEGPVGPGANIGRLRLRLGDLYVCDDAGAMNNTFLGNVRARWMATAGAGSSTDFTISGVAATNWQTVQNKAITDAGGYVYSSTPGDADLYTVDPILGAQVVHGVQLRTAARMDDATQRVLRNQFRIGATTGEGVDHYVNQTFTGYLDVVELNPDTGLAMLGTDVNAAEIGPKVEA